jgi:transposase-like protein
MKSIFNEQQLIAIELLAQGGKTYKEIAELSDTTAETLRQWRKLPEFQDNIKNRCRELLKDMEPTLYALAFKKAVADGSWQHIKLLLSRIERLEDIAEGRGQDYAIMFRWKDDTDVHDTPDI